MNGNNNWTIEDINAQYKLLAKINGDLASIKVRLDKWSRKEIIGHLIDSANVNYNRFIRALDKNDLIFDTYPQNEWVELQGYNRRNWDELLNLWNLLNLHIIELVNNIPDDKKYNETSQHNFDKICWKVIEKGEQSSLDYLIKDYIGHLKHHLNKIYNY